MESLHFAIKKTPPLNPRSKDIIPDIDWRHLFSSHKVFFLLLCYYCCLLFVAAVAQAFVLNPGVSPSLETV